jgi:23S rRNA (guanosine2251-2'-O)-methyltransferase
MRKLLLSELNRISISQFKGAEKTPLIVVLDNIRSLNNIGSVFRTADAFRLESIYLCGITGTPPNKEIHKTALGATESVNWKYFNNTIDAIAELKGLNFSVYAIEQAETSIFINDFIPELNSKIAVVFGNEVQGVSETVMNTIDGCIEIPQFGTKHSLNIAVSAGIIIWELFNKLKSKQ